MVCLCKGGMTWLVTACNGEIWFLHMCGGPNKEIQYCIALRVRNGTYHLLLSLRQDPFKKVLAMYMGYDKL